MNQPTDTTVKPIFKSIDEIYEYYFMGIVDEKSFHNIVDALQSYYCMLVEDRVINEVPTIRNLKLQVHKRIPQFKELNVGHIQPFYIKFSAPSGKFYDDYYMELDGNDNTWKGASDSIESALDEMYCENNEDMTKIKLTIEFTETLPEGVEL